jgi:hypothetical protein
VKVEPFTAVKSLNLRASTLGVGAGPVFPAQAANARTENKTVRVSSFRIVSNDPSMGLIN